MKKKQLLLTMMLLLASVTGVYADNGTLSVSNIKSVVPGYNTGSLDIVLSGSDVMYAGYQFSLTLPEGLTYEGYSNGPLINGHTATISGTTTKLFTGAANPTANFTAMNGTLLTIYFSVNDNATGTLTGGLLSGIVMSTAGAAEINLSNQEFSAPVVDIVTLDESDAVAPAAIEGVGVTVNRTIAADTWSTLCLPFAMTSEQVTQAFGADVLIGDFTGYDLDDNENIKVNFDQVHAIEANRPYIIRVSNSITSFSVTGTAVAINPNTKPMKNVGESTSASKIKAIIGTYAPITLNEGWLYLKDNQFKYSAGNSKLKPFRAYFRFCDFDVPESRMTINFEEKTTGIKAIDNGQLIIDNGQCSMVNGQWSIFNLQGQRVARPAKGVYIREGKKYIIK